MKNWQTIPIPQLMLNLERDPRGLPVPYVVFKDKEGKHHFKINDTEKSFKCISEDLCSICGQEMEQENAWMVGGIASAFDEGGYYIDTPVHRECGTYALQVCPYLAYRGYNSKLDMDKLMAQVPGVLLENPTIDQDRLPLFVFLRPDDIKAFFGTITKLKAIKPYHEVEFWDNGEQIIDLEIVKSKLIGTKWEKYLKEILC